ncbi:MAG: hypothetical protein ABI791_13840 [Acidobacteriota bacterium]
MQEGDRYGHLFVFNEITWNGIDAAENRFEKFDLVKCSSRFHSYQGSELSRDAQRNNCLTILFTTRGLQIYTKGRDTRQGFK